MTSRSHTGARPESLTVSKRPDQLLQFHFHPFTERRLVRRACASLGGGRGCSRGACDCDAEVSDPRVLRWDARKRTARAQTSGRSEFRLHTEARADDERGRRVGLDGRPDPACWDQRPDGPRGRQVARRAHYGFAPGEPPVNRRKKETVIMSTAQARELLTRITATTGLARAEGHPACPLRVTCGCFWRRWVVRRPMRTLTATLAATVVAGTITLTAAGAAESVQGRSDSSYIPLTLGAYTPGWLHPGARALFQIAVSLANGRVHPVSGVLLQLSRKSPQLGLEKKGTASFRIIDGVPTWKIPKVTSNVVTPTTKLLRLWFYTSPRARTKTRLCVVFTMRLGAQSEVGSPICARVAPKS